MQINQSFKVTDLKRGIVSLFLLDENNIWTSTSTGGSKITQKDAQTAYDYFSSQWQDYDVTEL